MWNHHLAVDYHEKRAITSSEHNEMNRVNSFIVQSFSSHLPCMLAVREGTMKLFHQGGTPFIRATLRLTTRNERTATP